MLYRCLLGSNLYNLRYLEICTYGCSLQNMATAFISYSILEKYLFAASPTHTYGCSLGRYVLQL